jgi:4a-hydroxytetrahydrobiopterin dehydratase
MGKKDTICKESETKALTEADLKELLEGIPQWSLGDRAIEREFTFRNFDEAMEFVNKIAALANAEDHHPDIFISYNRVRLTLTTHKTGGLTCKDFILAAKIDPAEASGR